MLKRSHVSSIIGPLLLSGAILYSSAESLPRFSAEQGVACTQCHFTPSGGAMRNEFGHFTMSVNELTLQSTKKKLLESYKGPRLSEAVTIGSDIRYRMRDEGQVERYQTDFYVSFEPFAHTFFNLGFNSNGIDESYLLVTNEARSWFVQGGRMYPQFGLRLEDFTASVKQRTAIFHRVALEGASVGATVGNTNLSVSYFSVGEQNVYFANLNGARFLGKLGIMGGLSARFSEELETGGHGNNFAVKGAYAGLGYSGHSLLIEGDLIGESNDSYAIYIGGTFRAIPGLYGKFDYNFYDPDRRIVSGAESFTRASIEFWPMPFVEINPGVTFYTDGTLDGEREFELRVHLAY